MSNIQDQISFYRKRKHREIDFTPHQPSEPRPSQQYKLHSAEFYDALSKVWLTRRALRELDRRANQINHPQSAPTSQRLHQEGIFKQIKRFSRQGGPDLGDLRGVSWNCPSLLVVANHNFSVSYAKRRPYFTHDEFKPLLTKF